MASYREKLFNQREFLNYLKTRMLYRMSTKTSAGLNQVYKRLDKYNEEIFKITKVLKDDHISKI